MPDQLTSPNFVYRPSVSLRRTASSTSQLSFVFVLVFEHEPRTRVTMTARLVMLVPWPGKEFFVVWRNNLELP